MSLTKIIVIVVVSGFALFVLLLVYALWPKIRDISDESQLAPYVGTPLTIYSPAFIYVSEKGQYRFIENVMSQNPQYDEQKKYDVPVGSVITIKKFKTYRNDAGSGFTDLFALGEYTTPSGEKLDFEYDWGNLDPGLYSGDTPALPRAPWQDSTAVLIKILKD